MSLIAGTGQRDLSPRRPMQLAGYPRVRRISTGIHDPLQATALFLRTKTTAAVLVALDLLMLNTSTARRIRRRVAETLAIDETGVLISCTHTHSAPVTLNYLPFRGDDAMPEPDPGYLGWIESRIVEAAREAQQRARPAELGWTSADGRGVGGNRHRADGPTDPEAGVLAVRTRAGGALLGVVLIYGMHPTVLHEDSPLVSGDFPHFARQHLRETLGEQVAVLYHTGPAGNQSPRYFVTGQTFAEAERLGRKLGAVVLASLAQVSYAAEIPLAAALRAVSLPRRQLPTVAQAEQQLLAARARYERLQGAGAERARVRTAEVDVFGAEAALALAGAAQTGVLDRFLAANEPVEIQVLRIGARDIVAFPGEMFVEYALELKRRAARPTVVVAYANGELQGYIVTPEAAAAGGYEAASSVFAPQAGQLLVEQALLLVQGIAGA